MAVGRRGERWQVKVRGLHGKTWSCTCDSKRQGEAVEREMRDCLLRGVEWIHPRRRRGPAPAVTLREVIVTYLRTNAPRWRPNTLTAYTFCLEAFHTWGEAAGLGLRALDEEPLLAWISEAVNLRSRSNRAAILSGLWRWASEQAPRRGWDVASFLRLRVKGPPRKRTWAPSWQEIDAMIAAMRSNAAYWRLACLQRFTGCRITETTMLEWTDYDEQRALLRLRPETTKGGYGGREIPVSPHLAKMLASWPRVNERVAGFTGRPQAMVFTRAWRRSGVRPEVWQRQPSHAIRKGVVTGLLALGASADAVEVLVGHRLDAVRNAYVDQERALNLRGVVDLLPPLDGVTSAPAYRARERQGNTPLPEQSSPDRYSREIGEIDGAKAPPKAPPSPSR